MTLYGDSSGAACAHLHLFSPLSEGESPSLTSPWKSRLNNSTFVQIFHDYPNQSTVCYSFHEGLFHKIILASGSATNGWFMTPANLTEKVSKEVARYLGAQETDVEDPAKRIDFLRAVFANETVQSIRWMVKDEVRE